MGAESLSNVAQAVTPELQKWSNEILAWVKGTGNLIEEQAPLVAQEIIRYGMVTEITSVILLAAYIVFFILAVKYIIKYHYEISQNEGVLCLSVICLVVGVLFLTCSVFSIWDHLQKLFQVFFAPRLYMIEYFSHLIK